MNFKKISKVIATIVRENSKIVSLFRGEFIYGERM